MSATTIEISSNILTGAAEIAAHRKEPLRRTAYLLEKGLLPAFKEGRIWRMTVSAHNKHLEALETAALARAAAASALSQAK